MAALGPRTVATSSTMRAGDADSVAMSGGLIVIGNSYYSNYRGLVSIYRASDGVLLKQFSGSGSNDYLGYSVAIDGDTVVAGAWEWPNEGFAKVYRTSDGGDTWTTAATLTASDGAKNDYFGRSVAVAGDTIFVGAYGDDDDGTNSGSVYVFRTTDGGATYDEVQTLRASSPKAGANFGNALAADGDTLVIGAYSDNSYKGAVYVFRKSFSTYAQVARLTGSGVAEDDEFGTSVDVSGDTIVVGTEYTDAAFVYRTSDGGATWAAVTTLEGSDDFGQSVAIDGDTIVIGASGGDATYVYRTSDGGATYAEVVKLTAPETGLGLLRQGRRRLGRGRERRGLRGDLRLRRDGAAPAPTGGAARAASAAAPRGRDGRDGGAHGHGRDGARGDELRGLVHVPQRLRDAALLRVQHGRRLVRTHPAGRRPGRLLERRQGLGGPRPVLLLRRGARAPLGRGRGGVERRPQLPPGRRAGHLALLVGRAHDHARALVVALPDDGGADILIGADDAFANHGAADPTALHGRAVAGREPRAHDRVSHRDAHHTFTLGDADAPAHAHAHDRDADVVGDDAGPVCFEARGGLRRPDRGGRRRALPGRPRFSGTRGGHGLRAGHLRARFRATAAPDDGLRRDHRPRGDVPPEQRGRHLVAVSWSAPRLLR